jgi:hypothetical protein
MRSNFFTPTLVLFLVLAGTVSVLPCKCVPSSLSSYYRRADAVVTGTVISVSTDDAKNITAKLGVSERWKRALPAQIDVITENSSCAYDLQVDGKYLLYLKAMPSGKFSTMQCQGNIVFDKSQKARNWLRRYGKMGKVEFNSVLFPNIFENSLTDVLEIVIDECP